MISGRFTPAAPTRIRISPASGTGTGRSAATRTSGPPGALITIAVIISGSVAKAAFLRGRVVDKGSTGSPAG